MYKCVDNCELHFFIYTPGKSTYLLLKKLDPNNPNASPMSNPSLTFLKKIPITKARIITKPNEINPLA
jgi:hypothetical protein